MKFVVTGGAGFIGNNIVKLLIKKGHDVDIIDNLHTGEKENLNEVIDKINFYQIDIRNKKDLEKIIKNCDGIFHEAALTAVPESFENPKEYHDVNVIGTRNIFEIAEKGDIRVVYASSSSIYGDSKSIPIKENAEKKPINPYGQTKLDDEFLAERFSKNDLSVIGLRYFNVYGIGQVGSYAGVITKFLENIKNEKSFIINGDGNQIRDFIHVKDIANANVIAMESEINSGFFNIGTGIPTSINDLAKLMIKLSNHKHETIHGPELKGDVKISQADINSTNKSFNLNHKINLQDGLRDLIKNYLSLNSQK
ncbi:MAG: NAD-dependent epimerase [Thaumarchaeota archaeon]|nr:MAG: NAD-dependent epimerase [Nitrososphaerota archaeon]